MIGAQEWYYAVLFLTAIIALIVYFSVSKKISHFLYISFVGLYIVMLDYDLQVLGVHFENHDLLKFIAYLFSTLLFLYLGIVISKREEKNRKEKYNKNRKEKKEKNKLTKKEKEKKQPKINDTK